MVKLPVPVSKDKESTQIPELRSPGLGENPPRELSFLLSTHCVLGT